MSPPGDAACGHSYACNPCEELKQEPIAENNESRDRKKKDQDEGQDTGSWIENNVGAHNAGDSAAGSERR